MLCCLSKEGPTTSSGTIRLSNDVQYCIGKQDAPRATEERAPSRLVLTKWVQSISNQLDSSVVRKGLGKNVKSESVVEDLLVGNLGCQDEGYHSGLVKPGGFRIGIFPFVFKELTRRNSKNRKVGTLETKPISSVTKDVTRSCLIDKVLPAIRAKWPSYSDKTIFIRQDNAKPHIGIDNEEFLQATSVDDSNFHMSFQPPNSPDLNVLDLGYFRAIQSLQHQESPTTIDELVKVVEKSFDELAPESLNNVFLFL
ncbi:hypothetical protein V6N13_068205 [Hibiscus sabdariffa]|uniref:Transposase n=1 Tax=Hibiscus sabdariffa TaxID=183260 RepID=A0ABR1ZYA9_9ROSI